MRRLLILVSAIVFLDTLLFGALIPLIPGFADEYALSKLQAGLLVGAFGGGALLGGIPGGLLAGRVGPKRAVVAGLAVLALASFGFALAGSAVALGAARFVQGFSSTLTWSGALAWISIEAPRHRRGEMIGNVLGIAVLGTILGPMLGVAARVTSIRFAFVAVGLVAAALAVAAAAHPRARGEQHVPGALARAFSDPGFVAGLWLSTVPALMFGVLDVLAPLALDAGGFGAVAIGVVFFTAGLAEVGLNPAVGRFSDRHGRLLPIRLALSASVIVAALLAVSTQPLVIAFLVAAASVSFGGLFTPGMALVSDRAELAGLTQGLGFGVMNTAWAVGALVGPSVGGGLAGWRGDALPYLLCSALCGLTLLAIARRPRGAPTAA
jgi:MFS family permease